MPIFAQQATEQAEPCFSTVLLAPKMRDLSLSSSRASLAVVEKIANLNRSTDRKQAGDKKAR